MAGDFLSQILILLAGSLLVLSLVRRFRLPPILGYLVVGMLLGPNAFGLVPNDATVRLLAEIGIVFLVFTLGLEFSLARMVAMKSEVLGIGVQPGAAIVIGGALAMSSTAIVLRQLGDQLELSRTHARLAVGILLFQDLAFAPLLALATALEGAGEVPGPFWLLGMVGRATTALGPEGTVFVRGEYWRADAEQPIEVNERVEALAVEGLRLRVRRAPRRV